MAIPLHPVAGRLSLLLLSRLFLFASFWIYTLRVFEFKNSVPRFLNDVVTPHWWSIWLDDIGVGVPRFSLETETTKLVNKYTTYLCFSTFLLA